MSCIESNVAINNSGYSHVWYKGKKIGAHRAAWMEHHGKEIPEGMVVMHSCDNRRCVNPEHLSLGTQSDNLKDMVAKGRQVLRDVSGFNNPRCKVSPTTLEIIRLSPLGSLKLAEYINLSSGRIRQIRREKAWLKF